MPSLSDRFRGLLLGTAVGDAIGLPAEGISRARAGRMFKGHLRHRFLGPYGMISDDTEHTLFVAQCLLAHPASQERFGARLGWCMRWWFAALPAGVGLATARACMKLWIGFGFRSSGVCSAGNGPAMRVALIGAFFAESPDKMASYTSVSTRLTHTHPAALIGARAIAATAAWIVRDSLVQRPAPSVFCAMLKDLAPDDPTWCDLVAKMEGALLDDVTVDEFASRIGLLPEVTGYIYHTVPVALYAWHKHLGDFRASVSAVVKCGGDTDTTGSIVGALAGLTVGESGIPSDWIQNIKDWPRSTHLLRRVADRLTELKEGGSPGVVRYPWLGIVPRNAFFLLVVLLHGFRRLLPPY